MPTVSAAATAKNSFRNIVASLHVIMLLSFRNLLDGVDLLEQAVNSLPEHCRAQESVESADLAAAIDQDKSGRTAHGTVERDVGQVGGNLVGNIYASERCFAP